MKKPVRVLQVLDFINHNSGVSSVVMNYYLHLKLTNVQCDFLLYEEAEEELELELKNRGACIYVTGQPAGTGIAAYRKRVDQFFKQHENEYDVVHIHIPNAAFIVLRSAKKYGVPVRIVHSHNARGADGRIKKIRNFILNRWGLHYANQYYACSKAAGRYLFGKNKMDCGQVSILNNAVDLKKYSYNLWNREKIRRKLGMKDEILLGHVGRFVEQKNHEGLLNIFAELQKRNICCKMVLLGDGPLRKEIEQRAEKEVPGKVIFEGVVNHVEEYMSAMDMFILPSLYEGLPVVCVEAQAAALPCLVSENITNEIKLTEHVYFMDNADVSGWCDKIESLLKQLPERKKCLDMDAYDINKQAARLEEMYLSYGMGTDIDVHL